MSDIVELVRRVRKKAGERYPVYIYDETLLGELADALEAQAKRIAELEDRLPNWVSYNCGFAQAIEMATNRDKIAEAIFNAAAPRKPDGVTAWTFKECVELNWKLDEDYEMADAVVATIKAMKPPAPK